VVNLQTDGSVIRRRHDVAACRVYDLAVDVGGCGSLQDVREALASALRGREGCARVTLTGELSPDVVLDRQNLESVPHTLDALVLRLDRVQTGYDLEQLRHEQTVRGQFVRDVQENQTLDDDQRRRVLLTGLRALAGRTDLEVA